jgi:hypothetical protein
MTAPDPTPREGKDSTERPAPDDHVDLPAAALQAFVPPEEVGSIETKAIEGLVQVSARTHNTSSVQLLLDDDDALELAEDLQEAAADATIAPEE